MSLKSNFTFHSSTLQEFFGIGEKQNGNIQIPLYQRKYKWNEEQIEPLIDDIIARSSDGHEHYFGVIAKSNYSCVEQNKEIIYQRIIDGQQRLTTSILIINFLSKKIREEEKEGLKGGFAFEFPKINFSHEIKTVELDYISKIVDSTEFENTKGHISLVEKIISKYFLKKGVSGLTEYKLCYRAFINLFKFAVLEYKIEQSEEMLVFENLNSKGSPLDEYDLLRNYIISLNINSNPKDSLDSFNKKISNLTSQGTYSLKEKDAEKVFVNFLEFFLTWKLKELKYFKNYKIYRNLKLYIENESIQYDDLILEIHNWFLLFLSATHQKGVIHNELWFHVVDQKNVHIPFVFALFNKYSNLNNNEWEMNQQIKEFMKVLSSYLIRLISVDGTGQSLGPNLIKPIIQKLKTFDSSEDLQNYLQKEHNWKSDNIFKASLLINQKQWIQKAILDIIETTTLSKINETLNYRERSIEHILPKKPKVNDWVVMKEQYFEEKHKEHLDVIGNVTFVDKSINSGIGNIAFKDKKIKCFSKSHSPLINGKGLKLKALEDYQQWNFEQIKNRTEELIEIIVQII